MTFFHNWGIPLVGLLVWVALILIVIPATMSYLARRAEQRALTFNAILLSALGTPSGEEGYVRQMGTFFLLRQI